MIRNALTRGQVITIWGPGAFRPWPQTSISLKVFLRMVTNTVVFTMNLAPNVANTVVFTMSPAFVLFD